MKIGLLFLWLMIIISANTSMVDGGGNSYNGLLIALGDKAVAYYELKKPLFAKNKIQNMQLLKEKYEYIPNEFIDTITIKKNFINHNILIRMRLKTGRIHHLIIKNSEFELPYQQNGINEFIKRFKK